MAQTGTILKITEDQNEYAKLVSSRMSSPNVRKKGMIDLIGITSAVNWFLASKIKVNVAKSLHKIPRLLEEFKITDIYYNNFRMDVITVFREKKIKIPRVHADFDIMPHFYIIVQIGSMLKEIKILGCVNPSDVMASRSDSKFFYIDEDKVKDIEDLKRIIRTPAPIPSIVGKHLDCMSMFIRFIDNELSTSYKKMFIKHLLSCETCASKLIDVIEFDKAAKGVHTHPRTVEKYYNKFLLKSKELKATNAAPEAIMPRPKSKSTDLIGLAGQNIDLDKKPYSIEEMAERVSAGIKKNAIDLIFKDKPGFEGSSEIETTLPSRKKKKIATMILWIVVLVAILGFALTRHTNSTPDSITNADSEYSESTDALPAFEENQVDGHAQQGSVPKDYYDANYYGDVDYSAASKANGEPVIATINKISWEVPENLADKVNYKRFLQLVGKNIKLNLQNDLLLSNDTAKNSVIKVDIKFGHNGDIQNLKIQQSSGSNQIDEIIKKSVGETLSYMKPPQSGFGTKSTEITLVINL